MSKAGRCIACNTWSGMVVGPGMARNSRPARTTIVVFPCWQWGHASMAGWGRKAHRIRKVMHAAHGREYQGRVQFSTIITAMKHEPGKTASGSVRQRPEETAK